MIKCECDNPNGCDKSVSVSAYVYLSKIAKDFDFYNGSKPFIKSKGCLWITSPDFYIDHYLDAVLFERRTNEKGGRNEQHHN